MTTCGGGIQCQPMLVLQRLSSLPALECEEERLSEASGSSKIVLCGVVESVHDVGIDEPLREVLRLSKLLHILAPPLGEGADEVKRGMSRDVHSGHVTT